MSPSTYLSGTYADADPSEIEPGLLSLDGETFRAARYKGMTYYQANDNPQMFHVTASSSYAVFIPQRVVTAIKQVRV